MTQSPGVLAAWGHEPFESLTALAVPKQYTELCTSSVGRGK